MKHIHVQGTAIPALGFGTLYLDEKTALRMVGAAIAEGYRHIDTAQIYLNESPVGSAIKASGVPRDNIFLTTKVWFDKLTKKDFLPSVEESLRKLKTDYVDLLLIHWPNPEIPLEESVEQLQLARDKGYTKHIGVSNFPVKLVEQTLALGADIITNQVEYHPLIDQTKLHSYLREKNVTLTAYSPIAQGEIIGNQQLKEIGEKYGKNEIQVALRWMMQQPDVLALPRTSNEANLKSNFQIFDFELTTDDMAQVDKLKEQNRRVVTPDFAPEWD
ncbi:aldo/keto reductase [Pontibacter beigongshangensis]|uniref:aldo/keto reductase n=1 Tax=Pontibacter beigongshangensis TaxID=2574733 RepID=UPI00164FE926|nr:aldo/keto reductase [Pontibacter beigongshangensis]